MGKPRRAFAPEFKFQVVMDVLTGRKRRAEALREYQINESTLDGWMQKLQERGPSIFANEAPDTSSEVARIAELERVIGRLTVELEVSKKASSWLRSRS
jgi:transposase-like protein